MPPAARLTDMHVCPMQTPAVVPIPHVGGPIILGSFTVFTGMLPQARVSDMLICIGPPDIIAKGSAGVFVNCLPAARMGDSTVHGGTIVGGFPMVIIGEKGNANANNNNNNNKKPDKANTRKADDVAKGQGTDGDKVTHDSNNPAGAEEVMHNPAVIAATSEDQMAGSLQAAAAGGAPFCELCYPNGNSSGNGNDNGGDDHAGHNH